MTQYESYRFDTILAEDEDFDFVFDDETEAPESMDSTFVVRGKWILDGAGTLLEAADMARAYADLLEDLADKGYELSAAIEDDYGFATVKN